MLSPLFTSGKVPRFDELDHAVFGLNGFERGPDPEMKYIKTCTQPVNHWTMVDVEGRKIKLGRKTQIFKMVWKILGKGKDCGNRWAFWNLAGLNEDGKCFNLSK